MLYLINALEFGGAEIGLANLLEQGFFEDMHLDVVTVWSPDLRFLKRFPRVAERWHGALTDRPRSYTSLLSAIKEFWNVVGRLEPELVIASLPQAALIARLSKMAGAQFTLFTFEHVEKLSSSLATFVMRMSGKWSDGILADCEATLTAVRLTHGYSSNAYCAVLPLQNLKPQLSQPIVSNGNNSMHLIFVGRLSQQKNLSSLIRAVQLAVGAGVPVRLRIFGSGEEEEPLRMLSAKLQLNDRISFEGADFEWFKKLGKTGYLGVMPSVREGLSLTALQFLALGLPVVTTGAGEIKQYIHDGFNGFLSTGADSNHLAETIIRAWSCRDQWLAMRQRARKTAQDFEDRHGSKSHYRDVKNVILHALATPKR